MILRDPVHGLVSFESEEARIVEELLATREVQRLRRIRQLGLSSLVYPGADHTRFSHALGAAHVMTRFVNRLRELHGDLPFWQRVTTERARDAIAAALLHDVGHGPFSHLFEEALPDAPKHETWGQRVLLDPDSDVHRVLTRFDSSLPARVVDLMRGVHPLTFLARTVSGSFDVDRCDYLLRDAHFTGVSYGHFDLDWLLRSLRLGISHSENIAPPLAIDGLRGLPAIESFTLARLFMFQQVYFHKASRASEWMLAQLFARLRELVLDGTRVAGTPDALVKLVVDGDCDVQEYLTLDDAAAWTAIAAWKECKDPILSDFAKRLHSRELFKTFELYGDMLEPRAADEALATVRELAHAAGLDPERYVGLDDATDVPFDDDTDPLMVIFPDGTAARPADVSFLLGRLSGERMVRRRLILAPELRSATADRLGTNFMASQP